MKKNNLNRKRLHHFRIKFIVLLTVLLISIGGVTGQEKGDKIPDPSVSSNPLDTSTVKTEKKKEWFEKISIRGYAQVRYNRLLETNPLLSCDQCDKSWGENGGFFIRRTRIIFYGNVHDRVYIYIQPDFASAISSTGLHYVQLRDAYFDLFLDNNKEFRFRVGQSKVPYGFENLQSSQNRIPLDRHDALNSAVANERDLGVYFYYTPKKIRERFKDLVSSGLKGSGDYGVLGLGIYNGQTANKPEANNSAHYVYRLTYPFMLNNGQFIEASVQGYHGNVVINRTQTNGVSNEFFERRVAGTLVYYPQPLGFQAEFTMGNGPEFNSATKNVENQDLYGGYAQTMYMLKAGKQLIIPFARWHYYKGGKKQEIDARRYLVNEQEIGIEWQPFPAFELVAMYTMSDRTFEDFKNPNNRQRGNLLRLQAQFNF
ncbi:MAG TPA: porin [Bacteroidia bacterium]|nr:porin [Bacteroidia bacterium]